MIEVGDYVRLKNGKIAQIENINDFREPSMKYVLDFQMADLLFCGDEVLKQQIVKHSKNIIDLIEEGDYVNGNRIDIVEKDENGHVYYLQNTELPAVNKNEIKTILTKEQYEANCYKVEEEI